MGLPARYVSGYLETLPPPRQEKLQGSDASHAWLSVYVPEQGWTDFDPTNNQIPTAQHITTAWGRDYSDVTPLKGIIFGGGEHTLMVSVDVERIEN
jgi:transglutaminase-like putative cysteine protease